MKAGLRTRPKMFTSDKRKAHSNEGRTSSAPYVSQAPRVSSASRCHRPRTVADLLVLPSPYSGRRMRVTDHTPSRQVQPRGLGARRGSTQSGQKELALLSQCEPQRGNGIAPTALPQDRPMATRSLLSRGSDQGHDTLKLNTGEVLPAG